MSRCFPYPLPGYVRNGVPGDALIESVKLQKEREKSNVGRGKGRREKKEKRKEKKRIGQPCKIGHASSCMLLYPEKCDSEGNEVEAEQLENSGLTDEYGQPSNSNSDMSVTILSKKRKRHSYSHGSSSSCRQTHGNVQREVDALVSKDQQCSTSGGLRQSWDTDIKTKSADRTLQLQSTFAQVEAASRSKSHKDGTRWMNFHTTIVMSSGLFGTKPRGGQISKRCRGDNNGVLCNGGLWPHTHYLPQADIHALPYTIPF